MARESGSTGAGTATLQPRPSSNLGSPSRPISFHPPTGLSFSAYRFARASDDLEHQKRALKPQRVEVS
jgi:hypothetical protein